MDISCIVNAHRERHVVHPTLRSVLRSVALARECGLRVDVHVVLDDSDDETREVVARLIGNDGYVHHVNYGDLSASRNWAVQHCTGEYLAFIDGDDLWCHQWLVDSLMAARRESRRIVFHPEYNVYFGSAAPHVFHHVDMEDADYQPEFLLRMNYWTALSFARRDIYLEFPYRPNRIDDGFGYEDWTWNHETVTAGIIHKTVTGTSHFIRKGKAGTSLLDQTNQMRAIPRVLDLYALPAPCRKAAETRAPAKESTGTSTSLELQAA